MKPKCLMLGELRWSQQYYSRLCSLVCQLFSQIKTSARLEFSNRPALKFEANTLRLSDPRLHFYNNSDKDPLWLVGADKSELLQAVRDCLSQIFKAEQWDDVEMECALWMATILGDSLVLEKCLQRATDDMELEIPSCILSSLLHEAVESCFVDGVKILLKFGSDPSWRLYFSSVSLAPIDELMLPVIFKYPRQAPFDQFNSDRLEILRTLIENGADLLSQNFNGSIPLHHVGSLVLHSEQAARILIKKTPAEGLTFLVKKSTSKTRLNALAMSLNDICTLHSLAPHDQYKIVSSAIVPLLQSGVRLEPNIVDEMRIQDILKYCSRYSTQLFWLHLLMTCRSARNVLRTNSFISAVPPMSLMESCRHVITSMLPLGFDRRRQAICKLDLPSCLCDYLNYADVEVEARLELLT